MISYILYDSINTNIRLILKNVIFLVGTIEKNRYLCIIV